MSPAMKGGSLFFTLFAMLAVPGRFASLFFQEHGLNAAQIGVLLSTSALFSIVTTPFFCYVSDRSQSREVVVAVMSAIGAALFMLQYITLSSAVTLTLRFPILVIVFTAYYMFRAPAIPIVNAICVARLKDVHGVDGHLQFGKERLWGAISWGAASTVLGALMQWSGLGVDVIYAVIPIVTAMFIYISLRFYAEGPPHRTHHPANGTPVNDTSVNTPSVSQTACDVVLRDGVYSTAFFLLVFSISAGSSLFNLTFLYFVNDLHASYFLCGLSVVVTVIFEIPLFAIGPALLSRYGATKLVCLAGITYAVRVIGYAIVSSGWMALLLEPLHGVTFATIHVSSVAYVAHRTRGRSDGTAQGVLSFITGSAKVFGTAVGGIIMEFAGGRMLYLTAGLFVLFATVLFIIVSFMAHDEAAASVTVNPNMNQFAESSDSEERGPVDPCRAPPETTSEPELTPLLPNAQEVTS